MVLLVTYHAAQEGDFQLLLWLCIAYQHYSASEKIEIVQAMQKLIRLGLSHNEIKTTR